MSADPPCADRAARRRASCRLRRRAAGEAGAADDRRRVPPRAGRHAAVRHAEVRAARRQADVHRPSRRRHRDSRRLGRRWRADCGTPTARRICRRDAVESRRPAPLRRLRAARPTTATATATASSSASARARERPEITPCDACRGGLGRRTPALRIIARSRDSRFGGLPMRARTCERRICGVLLAGAAAALAATKLTPAEVKIDVLRRPAVHGRRPRPASSSR